MMVVDKMRRLERLAAELPKPQRGATEPLIQFLDMLRDEHGNAMLESDAAAESLFGPMSFLRFMFPMPMPLMRDCASSVRILELWPDLEDRTRRALRKYGTAERVAQAWKPPETPDGELRMLISVVVPLGLKILADTGYDVAGELMKSLEEGLAVQVREYQVARGAMIGGGG